MCDPAPSSGGGGGRNRDADNFAGSRYKPTANKGYKSNTSVTSKDLKSGNVTTYKAKSGTGSITVAKGAKLDDVPQVGNKPNSEVYDSTPTEAAPVVNVNDDTTDAPETVDTGSRKSGGSLKIGKIKASDLNDNGLTISRKARGTKSNQIIRRV